MRKLFISTFVSLFALTSTLFADIQQNQIVSTATGIIKVFNQDYNGTNRDYKLPKRFQRERIKAVAIIPDMVKTGVITTVQQGQGIFCIKNEDGSWSDPLFIQIRGVGIGAQAGYMSNDAILLFENTRSYSGIFTNSKTIDIGGDATIIGGASSHHMTDVPELGANILAVGRSDGVFIGMSIDKSSIKVNDQNNIDYYNRMFLDRDILSGSPRDSKYTKALKKALIQTFNTKK